MDISVILVLMISGLSGVSSLLPRYYFYVNEPKTWSEAQSYCREKYTDLATVENMKEMQMMFDSVDPSYIGSVYIGLRRGNTRRWGWSSGHDISQYLNWRPGEPNNGNMDGLCGASLYAQWIDIECANTFGFVCYSQSGVNRTFTYVSSRLTWRSAQTYCRQKYTDLATVSNVQDQQSLSNLIGHLDYTWIGLFLDLWEWSDQWKTSFRNWKSGQPYSSSGQNDCVVLVTAWQGQWDDTLCNLKLPFICYKAGASRNVLKLKIISDDNTVLNDFYEEQIILNQIKEKLKEGGVDSKVSWREKNGQVFQSEEE